MAGPNVYGQPDSALQAMARAAQQAHAIARREYMRGWAWGVVCGITAGISTTALAVWLWHVVHAALGTPTC